MLVANFDADCDDVHTSIHSRAAAFPLFLTLQTPRVLYAFNI